MAVRPIPQSIRTIGYLRIPMVVRYVWLPPKPCMMAKRECGSPDWRSLPLRGMQSPHQHRVIAGSTDDQGIHLDHIVGSSGCDGPIGGSPLGMSPACKAKENQKESATNLHSVTVLNRQFQQLSHSQQVDSLSKSMDCSNPVIHPCISVMNVPAFS